MKLIIDDLELKKIKYWVTKCPNEIGGLGQAKIVNGDIFVTKIHLLKQVVSSAEVELDDAPITELMTEILQNDALRELGSLQFWWHSHVNMGTFWSGTDRNTIEKLSKHGWCSALVINKKFDTKCAYQQGANNGYPTVFVDDIPLHITELDSSVKEFCDAEYDSKVTERVFTPKPLHNGWYHDRRGHSWFDENDFEDNMLYDLNGKPYGERIVKPVEPIKSDIPDMYQEDVKESQFIDEHYFHNKSGKKKTKVIKAHNKKQLNNIRGKR